MMIEVGIRSLRGDGCFASWLHARTHNGRIGYLWVISPAGIV